MSEASRRNLFLALCAVPLLQTGAHLSQSFVNYPGWYAFESEIFKACHGLIIPRPGSSMGVHTRGE
ncbi:MAG TPA: hypothetical protein VFZ56_08245 [Gemmatimonadaceae bacterium]